MSLIGIAGSGADLVPIVGISERGKHRVIDLQIGAADRFQQPHLLGIDVDKIVKEALLVRIDIAVAARDAKAVQQAWRRNRQLRYRVGGRFQEQKILAEDGLLQMQATDDFRQQYLVADVTRFIVKRPQLRATGHDPANAAQEIHVPAATAEFAIGHRLEPDILLALDGGADGFVFDTAQLLGRDLVPFKLVARFQHRLGAQKAADVLGPGWRFAAIGHWSTLARPPPPVCPIEYRQRMSSRSSMTHAADAR